MGNIELKPFQLEGARAIYKFRGRCLLADDQGLGKTIQALYWISRIPSYRPVVIVTPASMTFTWQSEAALHFGLRAEVLEGRAPQRKISLPGNIVILSYDVLPSWLKILQEHNPRCVIFDEVHYLKNPRAQRTKSATKLSQGVPSVVGLSGTPLTNCPIELWSIANIIRPGLFPTRMNYAWEYCKPRKAPWGWMFNGASNLDKLNRILRRNLMIRRSKKEVLPELPQKTRRMISLRLKDYSEYRKAEDDFINWLKSRSHARAKRAKKSQALTKVGYLLRLVAELKMDLTAQWIREFFETHPDEKLVAMTMHTDVIDDLRKRFPGSIVLDGRVAGRHRTEAVRKFQTNSRVQLVLGNWKAAGIGITLTAAHNAVALDFPWTPGDLVQGEDRIHRIGQKKPVTIYYLTAMLTIEERLVSILKRKATVLDHVLEGHGKSNGYGIFDELLRDME